jgi:hypothetical protein
MNEIGNCGESSAERERGLRKRLWCARTIEDPEQKTLDPAGVVRDLSEARLHESVKAGEVPCARSIDQFGGSRWRLRRMREYRALWVFYLFQMS